MREIGVYIPLWGLAEFPRWEDHLTKKPNKQTNNLIIFLSLYLCSVPTLKLSQVGKNLRG